MARTLKSINWRKVGVVVFLVLLVLGFSIPGFLNLGNTNSAVAAEPRLCQTDNDCILLCDKPLNVLCSQNLCQQKACEEFAVVPYAENPVTLFLKVLVTGQEINLSTPAGDTFVKVQKGQVQVFSKEMSLPQVLEKVSIVLGECLRIKTKEYCPDADHTLQLKVNGNESTVQYFPQEGDVVEISYS